MRSLFACVLIVVSLAACERQREAPAPTEAEQTASTPANTTTLEVRIDGMVCGGCAEAAQQALEGIDGVRSADVSFEKGMAKVVCDPGVSVDELVTALHNVEMNGEKMQFQASVVE
jgi:copper chaperone CopZ